MRNLMIGLALAGVTAAAQWIDYPTPGIPRTKDGKANLSAPAPKTSDGKPDLSGIWKASSGKYLADLAADGIDVGMLPWAAKVFQERQDNFGLDRPSGHCLPHSVTDFDAHPMPKKFVQSQGLFVMLFESYHSYRQIFTDGRPFPKEHDAAWFGYSVGKWEGDTLVVRTIDLNTKTWLDDGGHPHSEALQVIERFRRRDFGHVDLELTIDDPKTYAKPWSIHIPYEYVPDTELLDWVCENNKDPEHLVGK